MDAIGLFLSTSIILSLRVNEIGDDFMTKDMLSITSPSQLACILSWCVDFEFKNFKFRHPKSGYLLNASLTYDTDNHTFTVIFRKCGKYPQAFSVSPSFKDFSDLLVWMTKFGV